MSYKEWPHGKLISHMHGAYFACTGDDPYCNGMIAVFQASGCEALIGALQDFLKIAPHRWRALPADSFEKQCIRKAVAALEKAKVTVEPLYEC